MGFENRHKECEAQNTRSKREGVLDHHVGKPWVWGDSDAGQKGTGDQTWVRLPATIIGMVMKIIQDVDFIITNISCENHLDTCIRLGGDSGISRKGPPATPPPNDIVNKLTEVEDLWDEMEYSSEKRWCFI